MAGDKLATPRKAKICLYSSSGNEECDRDYETWSCCRGIDSELDFPNEYG
jgi:hypothetical protein